jgi:hypothetical protein
MNILQTTCWHPVPGAQPWEPGVKLEPIPIVEMCCPCCGKPIRMVATDLAHRIHDRELDYWKTTAEELQKRLCELRSIISKNGGVY